MGIPRSAGRHRELESSVSPDSAAAKIADEEVPRKARSIGSKSIKREENIKASGWDCFPIRGIPLFILGQVKRRTIPIVPFHNQASTAFALIDSDPLSEEKVRQFSPVHRIRYGIVIRILYQPVNISPGEHVGMNGDSAHAFEPRTHSFIPSRWLRH
jgi:hypothetical protein